MWGKSTGGASRPEDRCVFVPVWFGPAAPPSVQLRPTTTKRSEAAPPRLKSRFLFGFVHLRLPFVATRAVFFNYHSNNNFWVWLKARKMKQIKGRNKKWLTASICFPRYNPRWLASLRQSARILGNFDLRPHYSLCSFPLFSSLSFGHHITMDIY